MPFLLNLETPSDGIKTGGKLCEIGGWTPKRDGIGSKMYDATLKNEASYQSGMSS
jgi:hypothetical protein